MAMLVYLWVMSLPKSETMNYIYPSVMYVIIAPILLLFIYYLYLAFRLKSYGEKLWLCLLLVTLPSVLIIAVLLINAIASYSSDIQFGIFIWFYVALIIASLVSGSSVYWVMKKYGQKTIFTHFYAFFYFFNAFVLTGLSLSIFFSFMTVNPKLGELNFEPLLAFFSYALKIIPFYGIAVLISGIGIMDYRLRKLKAKDKG